MDFFMATIDRPWQDLVGKAMDCNFSLDADEVVGNSSANSFPFSA